MKADENSIKSLLKLLNKGIHSINRYNHLDILQLLYSLDEKFFIDDPYSLNIVFKLHIALNNTEYVENYFTRMIQLNAKGLDETTVSMMISGAFIYIHKKGNIMLYFMFLLFLFLTLLQLSHRFFFPSLIF